MHIRKYCAYSYKFCSSTRIRWAIWVTALAYFNALLPLVIKCGKSRQVHWLTKESLLAQVGTSSDTSASRAPKARAKKNWGLGTKPSPKIPREAWKKKSRQTHWLTKGSFLPRLGTKSDISGSRAPKARAKKNFGFWWHDLEKIIGILSETEQIARDRQGASEGKIGFWGHDFKKTYRKNRY